MLAMLHHVLGAASFTLDPYQLGGKGNDDGIESGAWWFYYKLGFRPRAARREARACERSSRDCEREPASTARARRRCASSRPGHLVFDVDARRPVPLPPLAAIGMRIADRLTARGDRERGLAGSEPRGDAGYVGLRSLAGWTVGRAAGVAALEPADPDAARCRALERCRTGARWSGSSARRAGSARPEFVARFNAHPLLGRVLFGQR